VPSSQELQAFERQQGDGAAGAAAAIRCQHTLIKRPALGTSVSTVVSVEAMGLSTSQMKLSHHPCPGQAASSVFIQRRSVIIPGCFHQPLCRPIGASCAGPAATTWRHTRGFAAELFATSSRVAHLVPLIRVAKAQQQPRRAHAYAEIGRSKQLPGHRVSVSLTFGLLQR